MSKDPKRILEDEAPGPLAAMLRAAHGDGLTKEEIERVRAGLAGAAILAGAGAAAKGTGLLSSSLSAKVGLALAVVGLASGAAWLALRDGAPPPASPPATSAKVEPAAPVGSAIAELQEEQAPSPPTTTATQPSSQPPQAPSTTPTAGRAAPAPSAAASSNPANEGALLLEARAVLESDPARALELVRQHERQFPNSQLAPERARIEAEATKRGGSR
jgi:hypothetical protein